MKIILFSVLAFLFVSGCKNNCVDVRSDKRSIDRAKWLMYVYLQDDSVSDRKSNVKSLLECNFRFLLRTNHGDTSYYVFWVYDKDSVIRLHPNPRDQAGITFTRDNTFPTYWEGEPIPKSFKNEKAIIQKSERTLCEKYKSRKFRFNPWLEDKLKCNCPD